ncbi:transporter substrate-binding domain-containing protein [Enterococcus sp. 669A]|uniref:Transporter substrate-binding domain-containing protein n=1 Tax=Candidatus Enterococcus moelleringii TaxID=2815325 RepID=A0ABS3LCM8_9ENTE|nr:transporter substrate-binding domain-containing protein [Enterococcus sp. 669A]MBO1307386.1 transporter substrate-binding domain-containing protein [Enterococcus sp. 669A]
MKKLAIITSLLAALVLSACSNGQENQSASSTGTEERKVLRVGTEGSYRPFSYHNDEDELVGYDVEVAQAVAEQMGYEVEFHEAAWDSMLAAFDGDRTDAIFNQVSITDERREKYDFSEPYSVAHIALIVHEDNNEIQDFSDLTGKGVAQTITSNFARLAEEEYDANVVSVETFNNSFDLVMNDRADATLNDDVIFYDYLNQQPDTPLKIAATLDEGVPAAVLLHKDDPLLDEINAALAELQADGTLTEISEKYFDRDITQ